VGGYAWLLEGAHACEKGAHAYGGRARTLAKKGACMSAGGAHPCGKGAHTCGGRVRTHTRGGGRMPAGGHALHLGGTHASGRARMPVERAYT
jgi:hypothetical protein